MSLPPEASLDDVKVRIRESIKNPNVGKVEQVVLKEDGGPKHQSALRTLNAHLHGIEVLTFDQLLRIAQRVLDVFDAA